MIKKIINKLYFSVYMPRSWVIFKSGYSLVVLWLCYTRAVFITRHCNLIGLVVLCSGGIYAQAVYLGHIVTVLYSGWIYTQAMYLDHFRLCYVQVVFMHKQCTLVMLWLCCTQAVFIPRKTLCASVIYILILGCFWPSQYIGTILLIFYTQKLYLVKYSFTWTRETNRPMIIIDTNKIFYLFFWWWYSKTLSHNCGLFFKLRLYYIDIFHFIIVIPM